MFKFLLIALAIQLPHPQDDYAVGYEKAKSTGKVWMIIIGSDTCGPCRTMYGLSETYSDIIVTKIKPDHPVASKYSSQYEAIGGEPVSSIPDWMLVRFSDDGKKFDHFERHRGTCTLKTFKQMVLRARNDDEIYHFEKCLMK